MNCTTHAQGPIDSQRSHAHEGEAQMKPSADSFIEKRKTNIERDLNNSIVIIHEKRVTRAMSTIEKMGNTVEGTEKESKRDSTFFSESGPKPQAHTGRRRTDWEQ